MRIFFAFWFSLRETTDGRGTGIPSSGFVSTDSEVLRRS